MDLSQKVPVRVVNLNRWRKGFVTFVESEAQEKINYFAMEKEDSGVCMMLLLQDLYDKTIQLHGLTIGADQTAELTNFGEVYSFDKFLADNPSNSIQDDIEKKLPETFKKYAYMDAKIRGAQLIQNPMDNTIERSLIVQYDDRIVRLGVDGQKGVDLKLKSTVNKTYDMICEPKEMVKVNLVRGVAKKIFYAKRVGQSDKIYMVKHGNQKGEIENEEIFQLTSGKLISFAVDAYNLRLMRAKKAYQLKHQSFFVLTDQQTVIQVYSNDEIKFRQLNTYDIGNYNLNVELQKINDQAFQTIAFSKDSVTLPNMFTYTLSTELRTEL